MIVAIFSVVILAVILGLRQGGQIKKLNQNPNNREALIKLFNSCDAPYTYEDAAKCGIKYLEGNPEDFEIMHKTASAFYQNKAGYGIRELLDNRIKQLENIVDNPQKFNLYMNRDKNFKEYASRLFMYYASALFASKEHTLSKYYEQKSNSLK